MSDPNLMEVLRTEKAVLKQNILRAMQELQVATNAHDQALAAYETWKTRIVNALPLTVATVPNGG